MMSQILLDIETEKSIKYSERLNTGTIWLLDKFVSTFQNAIGWLHIALFGRTLVFS
jgi:hypothetical protein